MINKTLSLSQSEQLVRRWLSLSLDSPNKKKKKSKTNS